MSASHAVIDVDALRRPSCYPGAPHDVEIVQTHISIVCLAGDRVYKLKKPVRLPFLDFSTPELRAHFCREELRLNRRLCPWVYLDVVPLAHGPDGLNFRGEGTIVDHAVLMARLPAGRMLDALLARNEVRTDEIERLAHTVAAFHRNADRGARARAAGTPAHLAARVRGNFTDARPYAGRIFDTELLDALAGRAEHDLATIMPALERRADTHVIDGHGDLHARNVCLTDPPAIYDCLEFSEAFRCGDVATEIAFMAMDLRYRGHAELAERFVSTYSEAAADSDLLGLLPSLVRYRTLVRAKVAAMAATDVDIGAEDRTGAAESAERHLRLAAATAVEEHGALWIAACGPPATGKSALLEALARETTWPILQSDRIRKELAGAAETTRLADDAYTASATDRTYDELLARAPHAGRVVLLDATWPTRARRDELRRAAQVAGASCLVVRLDVAPETARARLRERALDASAISDADVSVFERLAATFEPPSADEGPLLALPGDGAIGSRLDRILSHLLGQFR